jgi:hypothetical protein
MADAPGARFRHRIADCVADSVDVCAMIDAPPRFRVLAPIGGGLGVFPHVAVCGEIFLLRCIEARFRALARDAVIFIARRNG